MAWVRKAPSGRWRAEWRDPAGRKRSKTFRRQDDARRFLVALEADQLRGVVVDPRRGQVTLAAHWKTFREREARRLRPATLAIYDQSWRRIEPALGSRRLNTLTRADVDGFIGELVARGVGPATVLQVHRLLHRMLEVAVREDRLGRNVAHGVTLPAAPHRRERALTDVEVWKLANETPERWRAAILVMGFCGLRIGEVAGLAPESIDFLRRRINVETQLTEVAGQLHRQTPKNKRRRSVPVPSYVLEELAEHMLRFPGRDGLVFCGADGGPLRRNAWRRRVFAHAVAASGLEPLSPHDLRHTAVTLAINAGVPLMAVSAIAGHSSVAITGQVYAHLLGSIVDEAADRLECYGPQAANRRQKAAERRATQGNGVASVSALSRENIETGW